MPGLYRRVRFSDCDILTSSWTGLLNTFESLSWGQVTSKATLLSLSELPTS